MGSSWSLQMSLEATRCHPVGAVAVTQPRRQVPGTPGAAELRQVPRWRRHPARGERQHRIPELRKIIPGPPGWRNGNGGMEMEWEGRGSCAAAAPGGDGDKGHSQTKRQRHKGTERSRAGFLRAVRVRPAFRESLGGPEGRNREVTAWKRRWGARAEPWGCRRAPAPPPGRQHLHLHLQPRRGHPCRAVPHLCLAVAAPLCPSPRPQGRVPGAFGNLLLGVPSPPESPHPGRGYLRWARVVPGVPAVLVSPGEGWGCQM